MPRLFTSLLAVTAVGVFALGACGADREFANNEPPPFKEDDAGTPPKEGCFQCSPDLKSVLQGCGADAGEILERCPAGQGCGVDGCVDACTSAALSKGSVGCEFWMLPPDQGEKDEGAGACYAAMVANTWDVPVNLTAEWGTDPLDISKSIYTATRTSATDDPVYTPVEDALEPGQVAMNFLSQAGEVGRPNPICPQCRYTCPPGVVPAIMEDPIQHGTTKTKAFHLKTDVPVSAYSVFPYGGAKSFVPSATLLLPVASWDTSYLAVTAAGFGRSARPELDRRTLQLVAHEDDTKISMRPNVDIAEGVSVAPALSDQVAEWTLSKGQVLQITQLNSPSGSEIVSSKPIGMFGGSPCTFIPTGIPYCDATQQQIPPFSQWGSSYALVPYRSRLTGVDGATPPERVFWSFIGAADGTVLTYDPAKPPGAPETLAAGEVFTFRTDAIVTVKSQDAKHPFHVSVYMSSASDSGGSGARGETIGDPEFVNVVPSDQFLDRYVFFTDYTYPETSLTIVRRKTASGFKPVSLGCAGGELTGWQPLGESDEYEFTWVRLTTGYIPQKVEGKTCGYGRHEATSDGPFGLYVWGLGPYASYGYAGGMGSRPINEAPPVVVQ